LPARRLLTAQPEVPIAELMIQRVVAIPIPPRCSMRATCSSCTNSSPSRSSTKNASSAE
jgi:hypothetical protein